MTFGPNGEEAADKGVWMSIWVDDVDAVQRRCREQGLEITWPPTNMPWNVREMNVRQPDGHVFRISQALGQDLERACSSATWRPDSSRSARCLVCRSRCCSR